MQTRSHQYSISFQLGEKVELIAKTTELLGHVTGQSCAEYSVWGQLRSVV